MRAENTAVVRNKNVQARVTAEEMALLDRACARLHITRTEAAFQGIGKLIADQRLIEAKR